MIINIIIVSAEIILDTVFAVITGTQNMKEDILGRLDSTIIGKALRLWDERDL
jgi:hypothetical protein